MRVKSSLMGLLFLFSCSVMSNTLEPCGLYPARLFCLRNFLGKSTQGGCHFLLQMILPTHGLNLSSALAGGFFTTSHQGSPHEWDYYPLKKPQNSPALSTKWGNSEEFEVYNPEKCLHYNLTVSVHLGLPWLQNYGK